MVIIASQHKVFEATTSVLVLGVAGSCTAVIFQATEPGFAPECRALWSSAAQSP